MSCRPLVWLRVFTLKGCTAVLADRMLSKERTLLYTGISTWHCLDAHIAHESASCIQARGRVCDAKVQVPSAAGRAGEQAEAGGWKDEESQGERAGQAVTSALCREG